MEIYYKEFVKSLKKFFAEPDIVEQIEVNDWGYVFSYWTNNYCLSYDWHGLFTDFLVDANIDFCSGMNTVPSYAFFESKRLVEADLVNTIKIRSRAFRKSNIKTIILYKDKLTDLDVGILSGVEHPVTIVWDGTYAEWRKIRNNSNCWYDFKYGVFIKCIDGTFNEDNTYK